MGPTYVQECPAPGCGVIHDTTRHDEYYCPAHYLLNSEYRRLADERKAKWMMENSGWGTLVAWDD